MPKAAVNGIEIYYEEHGRGSPLLLLHGYPQNLTMWRKIMARLARHFTVVACDLRGYGDSAKPPGEDDHGGYSKRAMAGDQVDVMERHLARLQLDINCRGRVEHPGVDLLMQGDV